MTDLEKIRIAILEDQRDIEQAKFDQCMTEMKNLHSKFKSENFIYLVQSVVAHAAIKKIDFLISKHSTKQA